jgi:hypothetical protein
LESEAKSQLGGVVWQPFTLNAEPYTFVKVAYHNRSYKTEFLRLITTLTPAQALQRYKQRYCIESMFKHLKSNGFDLEALHLQYGYKIRSTMEILNKDMVRRWILPHLSDGPRFSYLPDSAPLADDTFYLQDLDRFRPSNSTFGYHLSFLYAPCHSNA